MVNSAALDDGGLPGDIRLMNATATVLTAIGLVAVIATALLWIGRQPMFALHTIRIEGDVTRNSVSTIRANAVPRLAGSFFTLDLASGRKAFEAVPWVRQAVIHRVWPNQLRVQLEEHRAVALWSGGTVNGEAASDRLVNHFGEVFEANLGDVEDDSLPTLDSPDGSSRHMLLMLGLLKPVFEAMDASVETLVLTGRGSWRAELDTGAVVELGRGSDEAVIARTQRFVGTLTQVTQRFQRPLEYADLRHNEGYAVRLKGITTTVISNDKPVKK